ncbi:hypothetical protein RLIN73S_00370 [Rhodanobacter lindaniclasticus]
MFKSTRHMHAEQFDRLTEDVGGANNASTGDDVTNYFEIVPSNHLQTLLWAEAERLSNLNVDEKNFKSERAVVEEEYRQSVLANPYGKLFNAIDPHSYTAHPYQRPTIGSIEDLEAASLQNVIDFHHTFYRPDNATLIVAGDFDPKQLAAWVDQYFGWIPKPATPIPQVTAKEPVRKQDKRYTVTERHRAAARGGDDLADPAGRGQRRPHPAAGSRRAAVARRLVAAVPVAGVSATRWRRRWARLPTRAWGRACSPPTRYSPAAISRPKRRSC